ACLGVAVEVGAGDGPDPVVRRAVGGGRAVGAERSREELVVLAALRVRRRRDAQLAVDGYAHPDLGGEDGVGATPRWVLVVGVAAVEEEVALVVEAGTHAA